MTRIAILMVATDGGQVAYRAVAGSKQSQGRTVGEALDALTAQLPAEEGSTVVIVQRFRPDRLFDGERQERLNALMERWREARDAGMPLAATEQAELDGLVEAELRAATFRSASLLDETEG